MAGLCGTAYNWMVYNPLFFTFFAGLIAGFFSAVMGLQTSEIQPGADLYLRWYVLTKPFVGALGAVVLYIIVYADSFSVELPGLQGIGSLTQGLKAAPVGANGFAFGFIMGFSKRITLPKLK